MMHRKRPQMMARPVLSGGVSCGRTIGSYVSPSASVTYAFCGRDFVSAASMAGYDAIMPLRPVIKSLEKVYGPPRARITDPFEMILLENVAYLVDDERREKTLERLRAAVGLSPEAILKHSREEIAEVIAGGGMKPEMRAEKVL